MKEMKVLHDYVIVKVDEYERTKGQVYVHEQWRTLPPTGEVTGVGPLVKDVKVGDRVQFLRFSALDGLEDNERICREINIVRVL